MNKSREELIADATDILFEELSDTDKPDCQRIATQLYDFYFKPGGPARVIPPGEVAQKFRQRYSRLALLKEEPGCLCTIRGETCAYHQFEAVDTGPLNPCDHPD